MRSLHVMINGVTVAPSWGDSSIAIRLTDGNLAAPVALIYLDGECTPVIEVLAVNAQVRQAVPRDA